MNMTEMRVRHILAAESRSVLLTALRTAGRPLSVTEAAEVLGLRPGTARFHLDLLVSAGLVDRQAERRATAGRPRIRYAARPAATGDGHEPPAPAASDDGYRRLASVLAGQLSGLDDPAGAAREAGRRWIEGAGAGPEASGLGAGATAPGPEAGGVVPGASAGSLPADDAVTAVAGLMDRLGFAPDLPVVGDRIQLRRCPFEAVARDHRAVVCGVHAGMLEQTFERLGGAVGVTRLEPFASDDPLLCVVHLQRAPTSTRRPPRTAP